MRSRFLFSVAFAVTFILIGSLSINATSDGEREQAVIGDKLLSVLESSTNEPVEVIVTFKGKGGPTDSHLKLLKSVGIKKGYHLTSLPMVATLATKDQIKQLTTNDDVYSIYFNKQVTYENEDATSITGVDKVRTDDSFRKANGGLPVSGDGIGVVINDSGVDGTHQDIEYGDHLVQNVDASLNLHALDQMLPITYVENIPNTDTESGHGTHVAGIVGGTGEMSGGKYEGVAPGADLIGYGSGAAVAIIDTLGGFDYALTHQQEYNIRVITNSWGSTSDVGTDFDPYDPINVATKQLYDRGIVTVFSAGNSGPGDSTISGNYKKAPWVITVAAGTKQGKLTDFSSRGVEGKSGSVEIDGETWTWEDRPTITAPGENIISTRVIAPISSLAVADDAENIDSAYLPYYTTMSGTSMAAPHVAGIVALMLDANPELSPAEVKEIIQDTATNMPGYEAWEVGAGYVNAHAAVDAAFNENEYGQTVNMYQTLNASVDTEEVNESFTIDYSPTNVNGNSYSFQVNDDTSELVARLNAKGLLDLTGNTINLTLTAPDGTTYSSGIYVLFPLYTDRTVQVVDPIPGQWKVSIEELEGSLALPETITGELSFKNIAGYSGLDDIKGHPAEEAIKLGVSEHLVDSFNDHKYKPDHVIKRIDLAKFLVMGAGIRQDSTHQYMLEDVPDHHLPFAQAVVTKGAALKDTTAGDDGVMLLTNEGEFAPKDKVVRSELAYSLVQSIGLQTEAEKLNSSDVTVQYKDQRIPLEDGNEIPAHLRGYVQLALDLNILNAFFDVKQEPYDLEPSVTAKFLPNESVTRGDYAVAISRFYETYLK
ncbi:S8 family serine peptidase [Salinibacillus xinjiangensis]|uniref:S8 family serine peptidase n=1 Tax=Salinibacillus xinjiangensis TaxID=1229268 RepID=UPI002B27C111|nr:S8 family serine peptidase [Salinibacillus xinjiangensis]